MDPVAPRAQLGQLAPGARIAQEDLAERLAVSRQPISHALQRLKQQGLVRDAGRRGLVIAPIEADYVDALYEVPHSTPSLPRPPRAGSTRPPGAVTRPPTIVSPRRVRCSGRSVRGPMAGAAGGAV